VAERRQKEEANRKSREEAAAKERAAAEEAARKAAQPAAPAVQPQQQAAPQMNGAQAAPPAAITQASTATVSAKTNNGVLAPTGVLTPMQEREAEHKRYMDLHRQLKVMRNETLEQAKQVGLKAQLGDMRREIKKLMGQMNKVDKLANRQAVSGQSISMEFCNRS
jgi:nucleoporin GLE1